MNLSDRLLLVWMLIITAIVAASRANALDQIVSIQGSVTVQGQGASQFHSVRVVTVLQYGDLIRLGRNSTIEVLCSNNTAQRVNSAGLYGLGELCPNSTTVRFNTRGRNPDDFLLFLTHRYIYATQFLEADPRLQWNSIAGVTHYRVQVRRGDEVIWQQSIANTEIQYAGASLQPGEIYQLIVTTTDDQQDEHSQSLRFSRLSETQAKALQTTIAQLESHHLSLEAHAIALANIYQGVAQPNTDPPTGSGLVMDAILVLNAIAPRSQTPYVHRLLGDLYLQIGLLKDAANYYQKTLNLTTLFSDPSEWAAAQVGLAKIAAVRGDRSAAEQSLQLARVGYGISPDPAQVEMIDQWLAALRSIDRL